QRAAFALTREQVVTGRISSLPVVQGDMLEFRFTPLDGSLQAGLRKPSILVRWYRDWPELHQGEVWRLDLKLKPARSRLNFSGADRERWYFAQDIAAVASVQSGTQSYAMRLDSGADPPLRQTIGEQLAAIMAEHPARGVIMALAVADRSQLSEPQWSRLRLTGTSHLLAISGMHVGLAAVLGFTLGRLLLVLLPVAVGLAHGLKLPWLCSLAAATWYALMAGLGTSTQRALIMLLTLGAVSLLARHTRPMHGLLLALAVVLAVNPLAPLGAGFWLSFMAVAVLMAIFVPRQIRHGRLGSLLPAQAGITLAMIPLGLYWFQQFTSLGLLANLVAIPWISLAVVPATILATMLAPLDTALSPFLLFMAAEAVLLLEHWLRWLESFAHYAAWLGPRPGGLLVLLATLGAFCLLLPRGLPQRVAGLLLLLPLLLPAWPKRGEARLELLDVGQGLAVLVETRDELLLYDSGPGDGRSWNLVTGVVAPAIANTGRRAPHRVVISHGDMDHAGGLHELRTRYPQASYLLTRHSGPGERCLPTASWRTPEARFTVLHPSPGLPYLGNDSSCVISVETGSGRILLSGDISKAIEQRLLQQGLGSHDFLVVAHHGSRSSSSEA
ncbi:MAG TPA: DNA internalization-related competence protein ComEC/Rec2, partial [Xanthomonadales bacterium]|nr:DNA internalization-related competence protein ComEC/Rec2 [Xanthomonadales bacterium]